MPLQTSNLCVTENIADICFGACEQAKTNNVPANAPAERTVDAACLRPNGNKPGCQTLMQAKQQQETKLPQRH